MSRKPLGATDGRAFAFAVATTAGVWIGLQLLTGAAAAAAAGACGFALWLGGRPRFRRLRLLGVRARRWWRLTNGNLFSNDYFEQ